MPHPFVCIQVAHPCIPNGHEEKVMIDGTEHLFVAESPSFSNCAVEMKKILNQKKPCEVTNREAPTQMPSWICFPSFLLTLAPE